MGSRLEHVELSPLVLRSRNGLPANSAFDLYDSDYQGCDYNNNWHSVVYGYRSTPLVPVFVLSVVVVHGKVRSSMDSYLFASAYTRGCSSGTTVESSCFGATRRASRHVYYILFFVSLAVCIIETVTLCFAFHCSVLCFVSSVQRR